MRVSTKARVFLGRHPKLPIDLAFGTGLKKKSKGTPRDYIQGLTRSLQAAYKSTSDKAKTADSNKRRYDMRAHAAVFKPRDCCLVRKLGPRISFKIDDRWEDIYVMDSRAEDLPVYMVVREDGLGPRQTAS